MRTLHPHEGFDVPPESTPLGPLDHELLAVFIAAAIDGCMPCQQTLLSDLAEDPATAGRMVEVACVAVHEQLGGLPPGLLAGGDGLAADGFREMASAGLDGRRDEMFAAGARLSAEDRRAAVVTAADLLVGLLTTMHPTPPFPGA